MPFLQDITLQTHTSYAKSLSLWLSQGRLSKARVLHIYYLLNAVRTATQW